MASILRVCGHEAPADSSRPRLRKAENHRIVEGAGRQSAVSDSSNDVESANTSVATPKPVTDTNMIWPACRRNMRRAGHSDIEATCSPKSTGVARVTGLSTPAARRRLLWENPPEA